MILCPMCENDSIETWVVESEVITNNQGKDTFYMTQGCQCRDCKKVWYEHYSGPVENFYWTDDI